MKKVRLPKVGEYVEVTWIDSGKDVSDTPNKALQEKLVTCKARGVVSQIKDETLWLCNDEADDDEHKSTYGMIWVPSIRQVQKFVAK